MTSTCFVMRTGNTENVTIAYGVKQAAAAAAAPSNVARSGRRPPPPPPSFAYDSPGRRLPRGDGGRVCANAGYSSMAWCVKSDLCKAAPPPGAAWSAACTLNQFPKLPLARAARSCRRFAPRGSTAISNSTLARAPAGGGAACWSTSRAPAARPAALEHKMHFTT